MTINQVHIHPVHIDYPAIQDHPTIGKSVSLRDIHVFLNVKKDFSSWGKVYLEKVQVLENIDFVLLPQKGEQNKRGGRGSCGGSNKKEYLISLDTAKHIAMMTRTDRAKDIRNYFIGCERKLNHLESDILVRDIQSLKDQLSFLNNQNKHIPLQPNLCMTAWQTKALLEKIDSIVAVHIQVKQRKLGRLQTIAWLRKSFHVKSYKHLPERYFAEIMRLLESHKTQYRQYTLAKLRQLKSLCPSIIGNHELIASKQLREKYPHYRSCSEMSAAWHVSGIHGASAVGVFLNKTKGKHDWSDIHQFKGVAGRTNQKEVMLEYPECKSFYSPDIQLLVQSFFLPKKNAFASRSTVDVQPELLFKKYH